MIKIGLLLPLTSFAGSALESAEDTRPALVAAQPYRALASNEDERSCKARLNGELLMRTELMFGLSRRRGGDITEREFQQFIDDRVTPRFPNGLTVLSVTGQFKDSSGALVQEQSKLLVLLYPFSRAHDERIEAIRAQYKGLFQQQSVLRLDAKMCASF